MGLFDGWNRYRTGKVICHIAESLLDSADVRARVDQRVDQNMSYFAGQKAKAKGDKNYKEHWSREEDPDYEEWCEYRRYCEKKKRNRRRY